MTGLVCRQTKGGGRGLVRFAALLAGMSIALTAGCSDDARTGPGVTIGVPPEQAGCEPVEMLRVPDVKPLGPRPVSARTYPQHPPSFGPYTSADDLSSRSAFFSLAEAPPADEVVGALRQGAIVLWYKAEAPPAVASAARRMALEFEQDRSVSFLSVPWNSRLGGFQANSEVVLSSWDNDRALRQVCDNVSESVILAFDQRAKPDSPVTSYEGSRRMVG